MTTDLIRVEDRFKAFRHYIEKRVKEIAHCQYYFDGTPDDEADGDLELCFDDGTFLTFSILGDGESITAHPSPVDIPESFEVGKGQICSWERVILTDTSQWNRLRKNMLTDIKAMIDVCNHTKQAVLSGCRLTFSSRDVVIFWNHGDNARFTLNDTSMLKPLTGVTTRFESIL